MKDGEHPMRKSKRIPKTKFPTAATIAYERSLVKMVLIATVNILKQYDKHVKDIERKDSQYTEDAFLSGIKKFLRNVKKAVTNAFVENRSQKAATNFVKAINNQQRYNFEQQARVKGIELSKHEPWVNEILTQNIKNNVSYIKNLENEMYERIDEIVREGVEKGWPSKKLRDKIIEQTGITKSRAEFLAVDQAGTIMGQITASRHQNLGITSYTWDTSGDERVREKHRDLDGKVFSYDDPPEVNGRKVLPGEDYRCRCVAMPVFDD